MLFGVLLVASSSCNGGDGGSSPAPTAPTPTPQGATLNLGTFTAALTIAATEHEYEVRIAVRESGGQTGAMLGNIELTLMADNGARGTANVDGAWPAARVGPGAVIQARAITLTHESAGSPTFTRLGLRIPYTDDRQTAGAITGTAIIQQPPTPPPATIFTIAGVVSEDPNGRPVVGARVHVLDGPNAGRASDTDGNGYYSIPGLRVGSFTIQATKSGYVPADRGLTLSADTRIDLRLRSAGGPPSPGPTPPPEPPEPPEPPDDDSMTCPTSPTSAPCGRPTARCNDGTYSCSQNRSGTCSQHGGVACWICPGPLCGR